MEILEKITLLTLEYLEKKYGKGGGIIIANWGYFLI